MNLTSIITDRNESHISLLFPEEFMYIGTPILGEGLGRTRRIINLKVDENYAGNGLEFEPPAQTIKAFSSAQGWKEPEIGFMTSASMNSYTAARKSSEGLMIAAGAKARVFLELGVKSRISDAVATGTGTDSNVILYPPIRPGSDPIEFAGMHTLTGELIALTVTDALKESIGKYV